ncbi:5-methylcytosine-specific restriction endonuclease McrBC GTP-binding regulatory subunit McrB [Virgibacillus natechei]|uniref:5-methylcytosine-specific restriction endonuclease McrBC GTP-binding regulatory subunit McrB n=1 Tax=Virgibacillus natechei TaxID=1216297 RepID=A0ABS4ILB7_9BACI|nr:AAA family ATPase [Virgibacillus natechei]MBP1971345.1 5-methylcytosine-specific restriction endonuclease McrBC GTP-binding regulatory subunit McrB [Virgibacillus natechei]UZD12920.1 AAA family ATPase [Virgibacillus natechei]
MREQIIYFGAPGTGKSHLVKEKLNGVSNDKIFRVTIHPEFTYSDFIGQLLPEENPMTHVVEFPFNKGQFTRALAEAYSDSNKNVYLILEEMSRGNVAAIFGDIFQLLDRNEYFVSKYPIRNKNIADQIVELRTDEVELPSNFNIMGTVNVNDQNVFPMDTAFKRRFDWEYVTSRPSLDDHGDRLKKLNNPKISIATDTNPSNNLVTTWQSFYTALNIFITDKEKGLGKSEDKQLGQFFVDFGKQITEDSHSGLHATARGAEEKINKMLKNKLLLYLWQDVQGSSSFNTSSKLFANDIRSFDDLYSNYGNDKVFSDIFIYDFLSPNLIKYPY